MALRVLLLFTIVLAPAVPAQESAAGGAMLGYVFDAPRKSIRPILGTPGAALLGAGLSLDVALERAVLSPEHDYALAVADGSWTVFMLTGDGAPARGAALAGISAEAQVALSPGGRAAVLADAPGGGGIHVVTGLPANPAISRTIPLGVDTAVVALAVSDDGDTVLAALGSPRPTITAFDEAGNPRPLLETDNPPTLELSASGNALVLDAAGNRVLLVRDVRGAAAVSTVAVAEDGIASPAGAVLSPDGSLAYVANPEYGNVVIFDLNQGSRSFVSCACKPEGVWKLNGEGVFRLSEFSGGPLWVLEVTSAEARIVFVPAPPESLEAEASRE
jgi:hypothetical protein